MNAMPMVYARILRKIGFNVIFFVDAKRANQLCRPEFHFSDIDYPYPNWIHEFQTPSQILSGVLPKTTAKKLRRRVKEIAGEQAGAYFLNGFNTALIPHLEAEAVKIALSHGSDLDTWADVSKKSALGQSFSRRSIFRYLPRFVSVFAIGLILKRQFSGFTEADRFVYFPREFNDDGRRVVELLEAAGGTYVQRYDATFEHLPRLRKRQTRGDGSYHIFSIVRFLMSSAPDANRGYMKGNEIILRAVAEYIARDPAAVVHFFEKGEDVDLAKRMCVELGIEKRVVWHPNLPFQEFAELLSNADVCIDQVGEQWIGAGVYAMAMGVPLIGNARRSIESGVWPSQNPVLNCHTQDQIVDALQSLSSIERRLSVGEESRLFIEEFMDPYRTLRRIFTEETLSSQEIE
tara:strand:- start:2339 stop:3550 length:1212 start_codon:yes stop_codon:yes gene_type:complete